MTSELGSIGWNSSSKELRLALNQLPHSELYINKLRTIHWAERRRIDQAARQEAFLLGRMWGLPQPMELVELTVIFQLKDKRVRDWDGMFAACKPWLDGFVDAGIIVDDDIWHIQNVNLKTLFWEDEQTVFIFKEVQDA